MIGFKNRLVTSILISLGVLFIQGCALYSTGSTEVGVRVRKIALVDQKGVDNRVYAPGATYFFFPFINDWYTFDTKLQNIEMTFQASRGDVPLRDDLLFKTIDGNDISLDVIVSYRVIPEKASEIVQYVAKNDKELRRKIVRVIARSRPRDIFGELSTEEFYNAEFRSQKAEDAKKILNAILEPFGVIVERVLTKDYRFNQAYQKAIEDKKVADQRTQQFKSATKAKVEEYKRKLEEAKGEVNEIVAKANGVFNRSKIEADAYYNQQAKLAQAILAEGKAEARGIRKMNQALAGSGGDVMVKLALAKALKDKRIVLLPTQSGFDIKTTDINQLLKVYGTQKIMNKNSSSKANQKGSE